MKSQIKFLLFSRIWLCFSFHLFVKHCGPWYEHSVTLSLYPINGRFYGSSQMRTLRKVYTLITLISCLIHCSSSILLYLSQPGLIHAPGNLHGIGGMVFSVTASFLFFIFFSPSLGQVGNKRSWKERVAPLGAFSFLAYLDEYWCPHNESLKAISQQTG